MAASDVTVVICGGGNGAHVMAGLASSIPNTHARVLTLFADEAERWTEAMKDGFTIRFNEEARETRRQEVAPFLVTKDPAVAAGQGADIIALVVPAFAHAMYLEALKPFIKPGMVIIGLPGQGGFEFAVWGILGSVSKDLTIINAASLPWACRIREFGKDVDILGTKATMNGAIARGTILPKMDISKMFQKVWGDHPDIVTKGNLLGMTLMCGNAYVHPSFMFAKWSDWDGKPVDEAPLFYHGADDKTIELIEGVTREVGQMADKVKLSHPGVDLCNVLSIYDLTLHYYEKDIEDKTDLKSVIVTNKSYAGLTHPMTKTEDGKYVPNFNFRYLTEDVPFGLVVLRGIGEITGVATPVIDKMILWAQPLIGKEYLKDGSLKGKDVMSSRSPQAFGFTTIQQLIQ